MFMGQDYSGFRNVSIYDTNLIRESSYIAGRLKKNGIETLEDLFLKDDLKEIDFGANTYSGTNGSIHFVNQQVRGIIRLLRYKYLNQEVFADVLFEKEYNLEKTHDLISMGSRDFNRFLNRSEYGKEINIDFKVLGFSDDDIHKILCISYKENGTKFNFCTMFETLSSNLKKYNFYFPSEKEKEIFTEKIILISSFINKKHKSNNNINDETTNIAVILEKEKKLLSELTRLNAESARLTARIEEIQQIKQNSNNKRK